jgi:hypothetical protein
MSLSKLDLAVTAALAVGLLWIEHEHRIILATPAAAEAAVSAASVCPETDDVPFSADCIAFIDGGVLPNVRSEPNTDGAAALSDAQQRAELHRPACPSSNENAPYSADCIKFLSGPYWSLGLNQDAP